MLSTVLISVLIAAGSVFAIPPVNWNSEAIAASSSTSTHQAKITDYFKPVSSKTPENPISQVQPVFNPNAPRVHANWPKDQSGLSPKQVCDNWRRDHQYESICVNDLIVECNYYHIVQDCSSLGGCSWNLLSKKNGPVCNEKPGGYKPWLDPEHPLNAGAGGKGGSEHQPVSSKPACRKPSPPSTTYGREFNLQTHISANLPKDKFGMTPKMVCEKSWRQLFGGEKICVNNLIVDCNTYKADEDCQSSGGCIWNSLGPMCAEKNPKKPDTKLTQPEPDFEADEEWINRYMSDPDHPLNCLK